MLYNYDDQEKEIEKFEQEQQQKQQQAQEQLQLQQEEQIAQQYQAQEQEAQERKEQEMIDYLKRQEEEEHFQSIEQENERNQAAVLLENELREQKEREKREYDLDKKYKTNESQDLFSYIGDELINQAMRKVDEFHQRHERNSEERARLKELEEVLDKTGDYLKEAKTVGELEKRTAEAKKTLETLESQCKQKENTSKERLIINRNINIANQIQKEAKKIQDKDQEINFTDRKTLHTELKRCYDKENITELRMTNEQLMQSVKNSTVAMREQSAAATEKIREIYTNCRDWEKHDRYDNSKYYYKEPPHLFRGEGIPKDSYAGKALEEQIKTRNEMEKGINDAERINASLMKLPPEQEHVIKVDRKEDYMEKIKEYAEEATRQQPSQERQKESTYELNMSK